MDGFSFDIRLEDHSEPLAFSYKVDRRFKVNPAQIVIKNNFLASAGLVQAAPDPNHRSYRPAMFNLNLGRIFIPMIYLAGLGHGPEVTPILFNQYLIALIITRTQTIKLFSRS